MTAASACAPETIGPTGPPQGHKPLRKRARIQRRPVEWISPDEQARRFDAMLVDIDRRALARVRDRCRSGEAAADLAVVDAIALRAAEERARVQNEKIAAERAQRREAGGDCDVGDVERRALAYIDKIDRGPGGARTASLMLVRGWALDEVTALAMLVEWAKNYHRPISRVDLIGMVRRASRSTRVGYGWLLENRR